jgi:putative endonuclease
MAQHNELGKWGECKAAEYLREKGLYIRHIDWHDKHRDLDIVAIDADMTTLYVIEVKTRSSETWGEPDEAIDLEKKNNIVKATTKYVSLYRLSHLQVRYDTISVIGTPETSCKIIYKEDAFSVVDSYLNYEQRRNRARYRRKPGTW